MSLFLLKTGRPPQPGESQEDTPQQGKSQEDSPQPGKSQEDPPQPGESQEDLLPTRKTALCSHLRIIGQQH